MVGIGSLAISFYMGYILFQMECKLYEVICFKDNSEFVFVRVYN